MTQYARDELERFQRFVITFAKDLAACAPAALLGKYPADRLPHRLLFSLFAFCSPLSCLPAQLKICGGGADTRLGERK
jgi:hypothetical protein